MDYQGKSPQELSDIAKRLTTPEEKLEFLRTTNCAVDSQLSNALGSMHVCYNVLIDMLDSASPNSESNMKPKR